ncbi:Ras GTPase activating protein ira2, partial [Rhizopus stolonifer]
TYVGTSSSSSSLSAKAFSGQSNFETLIDPPALDEALVTFLLSLMTRFLGQMHMIEERNDQLALLSSETANDTLAMAAKVDTQTLEYIREVYTTTGKILYYISASNWSTYYAKIKNAVNILGAVSENSEWNPPEVRILAFACLDIPKLHAILSGELLKDLDLADNNVDLSPYFLNMRIQGKLLFARMMRSAIWKWIEMKPSQFAEICASSTSRPLAGSEILFDMCNVAADNSRKKAILWPLQTILLALSPDLLVQAFLDDSRGLQNRRLKKALQSTKTQEISAICYVDLFKAATYISPHEDSILRHIAADVEDVLYEKVWDFSRAYTASSLSSSLGYTISYQTLVSDYFLARLRLDSQRTLAHLVPSLAEDDAPVVFKQAFVHACLTMVSTEEQTLSWNPTLDSMYDSICTPLRRIFIQTVKAELNSTARSDISTTTSGSKKLMNGNYDKRQPQQNTATLLQSMLKLFRLDPLCVLLGEKQNPARVDENAAIMTCMINLLRYSDKRVRKATVDCLGQLHNAENIGHWGPSSTIVNNFWKVSCQTVTTIAYQVLDCRQNEGLSKCLLELLAKILVSRNSFLNSVIETTYETTEGHERLQANITLEIALLVSLCSPVPEVCSLAVKCLGYLCIEAKLIDEDMMIDTASRNESLASFSHNMEIYQDLSFEEPVVQGIRKQTFVGRKAQQKRVRKYLRLINTPTPAILAAWEEVWKRWKLLTQIKIGGLVRHEKLRSTSTPRITAPIPVGRIETDDEKQTEWQNYTGFLAALGGSRLAADIMMEEEDEAAGRRTKMSDRIASPNRNTSMIEKFIAEMIELLTSDNVVIREGAKDTLGGDLSPSLYSILFHHLEATMANCFTADGDVICDNSNTLFVEQAVLVLKMVLDRLVDPNDCLLSIDFSTLIIQFANYINRLPHENYTSMRVMIMMCHLTEVLMLKKEQVIVRDDVKVRNKLLEIIVEWTSGFTLRVMTKSSATSNSVQNREVQRDLDQVCLKAIVALLHKLPLQTTDQGRDADRVMSKNRLFQKYFAFFTQLLDRCHRYELESSHTMIQLGSNVVANQNGNLHSLSKSSESYQYWGPLKESAVNAISNLLSANVDAGLKSTLAMGYHEDARTRTAFMKVLSNILNQGAQFDTLAENIVADRYEKLAELLVNADVDVAIALCDVCPASDIQGVAEVLLQCFESKGKVLTLLKTIVDREVFTTEQEATLFRGTNVATKLLSIFARESCIDYVRFTLQPAMELINSLPEESVSWEMDPQKISPHESISINRQNVCRATEIFLDTICNSTSSAPKYFRQELALISEAVSKRFPDASKTAVGGFVFLRLFNPAILTPEICGFSKSSLPRSKAVRKLLLQATRMMQNLANNMMFGAKETHLISLNDFITSNLYRVASFLREISMVPGPCPEKEESRGVHMDDIAFMNLHRYMSENLDKIARELSVRRAKSNTDTQKLLEWKRTMDKLSNLLAQLGPPNEVAKTELSTSRNYALVNSNNFYSEFMRRNKHRDLSNINSLNVFYQGGVSKDGRPVFYYICRNVVGDDFDFELLVYYMLRVMEPHLNQPFELLFDLSRFTESCELPIHWLNQFFQLIFSEMNDYLVAMHMFNPNFHMQRYIRKLPRILTNKLVKRTRFATTVNELAQYISLPEILDVEKESGMSITSAYLASAFKVMIPVQIRIGPSYFVVKTVKEQEIFWSLNTVLNNVYGMTDIANIFLPPVPPNKKASNEGEIHIITDSGRATLVLVVPNREEVYKYLLNRKKNFDTQLTETNHGIRPTDVPGRILNMALLNMGNENPALRSAAYNLLCSLCIFFRFSIDHKLMNARDLCIPYNSTDFIVGVSENLANTETHLTLEFLNEALLVPQILTLDYIQPWLKNLSMFLHAPCAKDATKVRDVIRSIIIITAEKTKVTAHIREKIWYTLKYIDELHNLILEESVQYSIENGIGSPQAEAMANTLVTLNTPSMRGKITRNARKALTATCQNCRPSLPKHSSWPEISCWIRIMLMISFHSTNKQKPLVTEIFHFVAMTVSTGPTFIRSSVHELVVNLIHTLVTNLSVSPENRKKLKYILDDVCDGKYRVHFGLNKSYANAFTITESTMTDDMEFMDLSSLEVIIRLLLDTIQYASPDTHTANSWRARWMSLVTSMTFQFNPALQSRSFVILGCLAQDEIDDDLLFQILVVLRNELARFDKNSPHLVISILMCLTNIIDNLSIKSRYLKPMFWLAMGMTQMNIPSIFSHAIKLLHATLRTLDTHKCFENQSVEQVMLQVRSKYVYIAHRIDSTIGISFDSNFTFAVAGMLLRGFQHADARDNIFSCLSAFLEIETKCVSTGTNQVDARCLGYFVGLLPFAAKNDALRELLRLAGVRDIDLENMHGPMDANMLIWQSIDIPNETISILLVSFLVGMLNLLDNEAERLFLYGFLSKAAVAIPEIFALVYDSLIPKMNSIVVSSDNVTLLDAVKDILITAFSEKGFYTAERANQQQMYLEQIGFSAFEGSAFGSPKENSIVSPQMISDLLHMICE